MILTDRLLLLVLRLGLLGLLLPAIVRRSDGNVCGGGKKKIRVSDRNFSDMIGRSKTVVPNFSKLRPPLKFYKRLPDR